MNAVQKSTTEHLGTASKIDRLDLLPAEIHGRVSSFLGPRRTLDSRRRMPSQKMMRETLTVFIQAEKDLLEAVEDFTEAEWFMEEAEPQAAATLQSWARTLSAKQKVQHVRKE